MEKICTEKHRRVDECLALHTQRLNNHSERLDRMEVFSSRLEERLDGLIKQLGRLNSNMMWFMGLILGGIVSFFFYALQNGLIK
ncbi:Haemolysin XhlA [Desulfonispora thiosulfatigenes DSM 11270]|uniref:Haemolysin XhlA n=2 Tax=Desulfonispora thiosulfatigenes TaxID=83661 RepID=A0A1W1VPN6_DESTI|nr:Haemolysin XhlA [Desulfonispora thiosulfatigenes DSM 11270]